MNKLVNRQSGFGVLEIAVAVAVVAIVGLLVWQLQDNHLAKNGSTSQSSEQSAETVPELKVKGDMKALGSYLEDIYVDEDLDTKEIDSALNE